MTMTRTNTVSKTEDGQVADIPALMTRLSQAAHSAVSQLGTLSSDAKTKAILLIADMVDADTAAVLAANAEDMREGKAKGLTAALLDRLELTPERVKGLTDALRKIANQPDPVGKILGESAQPNGLTIKKVSVPLGVIGVIYESRPGVTLDASALCLKSGNAVMLRGGSEAVHTNTALYASIQKALKAAGLPEGSIQLVPTQDRAAVGYMLGTPGIVDVIVPRGGRSLVERVERDARVPVFAHLDGICHLYLDHEANMAKAHEVIVNAKLRRPGICGALETLLVDEKALAAAAPILKDLADQGCIIRADTAIQALDPRFEAASDEDWATEYLDKILSVRVVSGLEDAVAHIAHYSSHHTDGILTDNAEKAAQFHAVVDSAIVMVNASTQFADGGEFGKGAEIGIATGRFHARGPVGADELTTYKYQVSGNYCTRPTQ